MTNFFIFNLKGQRKLYWSLKRNVRISFILKIIFGILCARPGSLGLESVAKNQEVELFNNDQIWFLKHAFQYKVNLLLLPAFQYTR